MSTISSGTLTASSIQTDYLNLLVAQLQYQNPLEPLDNNEMAAQLAQFSQLEQLESINSRFASILATTERAYANSLIDREVSFIGETESGAEDVVSGTVTEVYNSTTGDDSDIFLLVGDYTVGLDNLISVKD